MKFYVSVHAMLEADDAEAAFQKVAKWLSNPDRNEFILQADEASSQEPEELK